MTVRTRAELNSEADAALADNTTGDITPADVRGMAKNLADSMGTLKDENQPLEGGVSVTVKDLGNLSGATITLDVADRPIQKITNNGAGTIAPGTVNGCCYLEVINTTGAGAITTSAFTKVEGSFDTTTTSKFLCGVTVTANMSVLQILKVA